MSPDDRGVILLYHRIAEPVVDPFGLCVSPSRFDEQLDAIRYVGRPIRLSELARQLAEGVLETRSVVVTFDDGYTDNLHAGKPTLERYDIPATLFLATGYVDAGRRFWWEELTSLMLTTPVLPKELDLGIAGSWHRFGLEDRQATEADTPSPQGGWDIRDEPPGSRERVYRELWTLLKPLADSDRREALDELVRWSGDGAARSPDRPLTANEVRELIADGLVELGAHTVTHPVLACTPIEEQRREIAISKRRVEELAGSRVVAFSYPFGKPDDFIDETVTLLEQTGFACACTTVPATASALSHPLRLPRVQVENWTGDELVARLERVFEN